MMQGRIFRWLVEYHCTVNLVKCLKHMKDGKVIDRDGLPYSECYDENEVYKGLLLIASKDEMLSKLSEEDLIQDEEPDGFVELGGKESFFDYIKKQRSSDGAYLFDSKNSVITRVAALNNNHHKLSQNFPLYSMIPKDFVSYTESLTNVRNIGLKTRLAIKLPHVFDDLDTYQIKKSAYTDLGLGKVTHFNQDGLVEEFFLMQNNAVNGPFVFEEQGIVGVYRKYAKDNDGKIIKIVDEIVDVESLFDRESLIPCTENIIEIAVRDII